MDVCFGVMVTLVNVRKPRDCASAGRSALTPAALRAWANELAVASGTCCTSVLWDIDKFFDSIRAEDVLAAGLEQGYPAADLVLEPSMHLAQRCVQLSGVCSMLI